MDKYNIGVYGLGVMGSNLAKNMMNNGIATALYEKSSEIKKRFSCNTPQTQWKVFDTVKEMVEHTERPRKIFLMVTAGKVVDLVINDVLPYLESGDIIIDGGNSFFKDTERRIQDSSQKGIHYLGVGISGGEKGALYGPSMMAGGSLDAWNHSKNILQKIAAKTDNESCCTYVGIGGSGHYIKMIHNGIEYAIMQLIADTYSIMKNMLCLSQQEMVSIFKKWSTGRLSSYLIEITQNVLAKNDEDGKPLLEKILDVAKQNGTGMWTLNDAMERGIYIPTICEAVFARCFSANKKLRNEGQKALHSSSTTTSLENYSKVLEEALLAGIVCCYAQGISLIKQASLDLNWNINIEKSIKSWRAGCIIRSKILKNICTAIGENKENILFTKELSFINDLEPNWRFLVSEVIASGVSAPTLVSTITYYDSLRTAKMSTNVVQALRDCFGKHTYERIDKKGSFHTEWI